MKPPCAVARLSFDAMQNRIDLVAGFNETSANWKWHKVAQDTLDFCAHLLDEREQNFLRDIRFRRAPLTERQQRYIHWLCLKGARYGPPEFVARIESLLAYDEIIGESY
jgi:hypothetical protein